MERQTQKIIQYIREEDRTPIGCMVAIGDNNGVNIGFSLCNKWDKFNKERGIFIAENRAKSDKAFCYNSGYPEISNIPPSIINDIEKFIERVEFRFGCYPQNIFISKNN